MKCNVINIVNEGAFKEYGEALTLSLNEIGIDAKLTYDPNDFSNEMNIVTKAFREFNQGKMPGTRILYQSEELHNRREKGVYDLSNGWNRVLEMFQENCKIPVGTNNVVYCPYGYSPEYETDLPEVEEDIDVLFFGHMSPYRKEFHDSLISTGFTNRRKFVISEGIYGIERDKLIMRSKIVCNIKVQSYWFYAPLRGLLTQCKKKLYMIEKPNGGYGPYISEKHFVEYGNVHDFVRVADYWLDHDKERKDFSNEAYKDIKENCRWSKFIDESLKGIL